MKLAIRFALLVLSVTAVAPGSTAGAAEAYPAKRLTVVVPLPSGGPVDLMGRVIANALQERLKQTVIVENRVGAGGFVGSASVVRAAPNGYTLLATASSTLYSDLFVKDNSSILWRELAPISSAGYTALLLVAPADLKARTLKEFIAMARATPGKMNFSSLANSTQELEIIAFAQATGIQMTIIPFNGTPPMLGALLGGSVQFAMHSPASVKQQIDAGKIVPLAISSRERLEAMPDVPTAVEAGLQFESTYWVGLMGPLNLPTDVTAQLHAALSAGLKSPEVIARIKSLGFVPHSAGPEELSAGVLREAKYYAEIAKGAGVVPK